MVSKLVYLALSLPLLSSTALGAEAATSDDDAWCRRNVVEPLNNHEDCLPDVDLVKTETYSHLNPGRTFMGVGHLQISVFPYYYNISLGAALHATTTSGIVDLDRPACFWSTSTFNDPGTGTYLQITGCETARKRYLASVNGYQR